MDETKEYYLDLLIKYATTPLRTESGRWAFKINSIWGDAERVWFSIWDNGLVRIATRTNPHIAYYNANLREAALAYVTMHRLKQ